MVEIADEVVSGSESVSLVTDHFRLVIEPFDRAVIDGHVKPRQDVFLMAANHPGEFANGLQSGMRCPPKPLLEVLLSPGLCFVGPYITKAFLEEIGPVDLQVHALKAAEPGPLFWRQVPGVLEPDVPTVFHEVLMFFAFLTDLITTDLVNRFHQVANNMKFIENKGCLRSTFLDHFDIGLPHIAADTLQLACPLRPEILEKAAQGILGPFNPTPDQGL